VNIGVLADTHSPRFSLPTSVLHAFSDVDLIIHAGDFCGITVLQTLQSIAPVAGVWGNQDDDEIRSVLPLENRLDVAGKRLLVIHGHQKRTAVVSAQQAALQPDLDCVIFGHSHQACHELAGTVLLFNPGSPTWARSSGGLTYGFLRIADEITAEIHHLTGN
jgi:uncharacterized protein